MAAAAIAPWRRPSWGAATRSCSSSCGGTPVESCASRSGLAARALSCQGQSGRALQRQ